ncbi:hypothetical protein P775_11385 [Puniceibacterium antarcticum]|uniref:Uncharacterized protein n=1 Tax=Puniceibacterium antarcticum TaxID=1206336 RepID=A0A2G8RES4_9RHOB|nr:hypothetical protein P775_11385 [Puniceibacterium antarcticum]
MQVRHHAVKVAEAVLVQQLLGGDKTNAVHPRRAQQRMDAATHAGLSSRMAIRRGWDIRKIKLRGSLCAR